MMGGGVCWLDYDGDGWMDLFVVNSYGEGDIGGYGANPPRSVLFRNDHGRRFTKVYEAPPTRGEGCVAADLNGDGRTDLYVTTAQSDQLLWNNGGGKFTEGARAAGVVSFGWHSGAAVADVNGDGRPDLFVSGYTEPQGNIPGLARRLPDEPPRRPRRAVPQPREQALPRGRAASRARPEALRPLARRRLHRRERRRAARPLRRERRGPEPPVPEQAVRRPARVPAGRAGARATASPTRTPAWASRRPTTPATAAPTSSSRTRAARPTRSTARGRAAASPTRASPSSPPSAAT